MAKRSNDPLVPGAQSALDQLKLQVAQEVGWNSTNLSDLQMQIDQQKFEVASSIAVPLQQGYNGEITSRQAGSVGGRLGGRLGGQMVKQMIAQAEQSLSGQSQ
jgi:small acid-soluble spore protein D (minor alpha/beta-type SASP)